jgi:hypothetical protein
VTPYLILGGIILVLGIILWLMIQNIRMKSKISHLRSLYANGDKDCLGPHASISEWEQWAQRGLEASTARRQDGKT